MLHLNILFLSTMKLKVYPSKTVCYWNHKIPLNLTLSNHKCDNFLFKLTPAQLEDECKIEGKMKFRRTQFICQGL